MASFNKVIIAGNITRDPEAFTTNSGNLVVNFGLAINDKRKKDDSGDWIQDTTFVDITVFGQTAEYSVSYLKKGKTVLIEGFLKYDCWTAENGEKRSKLKVIGTRLQSLAIREQTETTVPQWGQQWNPPTQERQSAQRRVDYYDGWEEEEFPNQRQMNMELREPWAGESTPF